MGEYWHRIRAFVTDQLSAFEQRALQQQQKKVRGSGGNNNDDEGGFETNVSATVVDATAAGDAVEL